jgi:hypothetical protein
LNRARHRSRQSSDSKYWRIGKYYDNSGVQNAIDRGKSEIKFNANRSQSFEQPPWSGRSIYDSIQLKPKPFTRNSESKPNCQVSKKVSKINYSTRDYNLINHTSTNRPTPTTTSRQKGLGQSFDIQRPSRQELFADYQNSLNQNPKVFYKKIGEFTKFQDSCIRLSGKGPFFR